MLQRESPLWWEWTNRRFAWSWNRVLNWHFTGYEDYLLIDLSRVVEPSDEPDVSERDRAAYNAHTFVKSLPAVSVGGDVVPLQTTAGGNSCGTGGGGAQPVEFTLATVDCVAGTATGTVTDIGCDSNGVIISHTIDLVDTKNLLVGSAESLIGRTGEGFLIRAHALDQDIGFRAVRQVRQKDLVLGAPALGRGRYGCQSTG